MVATKTCGFKSHSVEHTGYYYYTFILQQHPRALNCWLIGTNKQVIFQTVALHQMIYLCLLQTKVLVLSKASCHLSSNISCLNQVAHCNIKMCLGGKSYSKSRKLPVINILVKLCGLLYHPSSSPVFQLLAILKMCRSNIVHSISDRCIFFFQVRRRGTK